MNVESELILWKTVAGAFAGIGATALLPIFGSIGSVTLVGSLLGGGGGGLVGLALCG